MTINVDCTEIGSDVMQVLHSLCYDRGGVLPDVFPRQAV